jgi:hypothetical protein
VLTNLNSPEDHRHSMSPIVSEILLVCATFFDTLKPRKPQTHTSKFITNNGFGKEKKMSLCPIELCDVSLDNRSYLKCWLTLCS